MYPATLLHTIALCVFSALACRWITSVWFASNLPAHLFAFFSKDEIEDRDAFRVWAAVRLPKFWSELLNCPVCFGTHAAWLSALTCWSLMLACGWEIPAAAILLAVPAAFAGKWSSEARINQSAVTNLISHPAPVPSAVTNSSQESSVFTTSPQPSISYDDSGWEERFPLADWDAEDPAQQLPEPPYSDKEEAMKEAGFSFSRGENGQIIILSVPKKENAVLAAMTTYGKSMFPGHARLKAEMEAELKRNKDSGCTTCELNQITHRYAKQFREAMTAARELLRKQGK